MGVRAFFGKIAAIGADLLFPDTKCICCGRELKEGRLCTECVSELVMNDKRRCVVCSRPIDGEGDLCYMCENRKYSFDSMTAVTEYKGSIRKMLLRYKEYNKAFLCDYFADLIAPEAAKIDFDVIVEVPSSPSQVRLRGYSQTKLIADSLAERMNKPSVRALSRSGRGKQSERSARERTKAIRKEYSILNADTVRGKKVLLLDDIYTTGSTMDVCSKLLKKAGADKVHGLTVAIARFDIRWE